jgi:hypothetical protein
MIKIIERMPAGTIGLRAVGKVTEDDYRQVLVPATTPRSGSRESMTMTDHVTPEGARRERHPDRGRQRSRGIRRTASIRPRGD